MISTDTELLLLSGYSVVLGVALAVCYGVFAFARMLVSPVEPATAIGRALSDLSAFVTDVLYSLFAGACVALMFFGLNSGRVRLLGVLGCGVGFCIYHFTLGRFIISRFGRAVTGVRRLIGLVYTHTVRRLLKVLYNIVKRMLRPLLLGIKKRKSKKKKGKAKDEKLEFLG